MPNKTQAQAQKYTYHVVSPAYGRDHHSAPEAEIAFLRGDDFKNEALTGGTYCSVRDFAKGTQVEVRYAKMRRLTIVTV